MHVHAPLRAHALIPFALLTLCCAAALADEPDLEPGPGPVLVLDPLVVTATGYEVPEEDLGNSLTVITRQDIEEQHFRTLPEALRTVPGVAIVQSGPMGTQTSAFTRGGNSDQTLVLLDGRPIGDPSTPNGQVDLAGIPLSNVEKIEVLRGPGASIYGSQAQAGVINIITRRGEGPVSVTAQAEFGTQNTFNQSLNANGQVEGVGFNANFNALYTDGFDITPTEYRPAGVGSERDGFREYNGSFSLNGDLSETLSASAYFGIEDARVDLDLSPEDPNSEQKTLNYFVNGTLEGRFLERRWLPKLSFGFADFDRRTTDAPDALSSTDIDTTQRGSRADLDFRNDFVLDRMNTVTLGAGLQRESFKQTGYSNYSGYVIDNDSSAKRLIWAAYAQHRLNYQDWFFLTSNVRGNIVEKSDNAATFSVTPLVRIEETGTTLHGSVGTGFQAPSLYELYGYSPTSGGTAFYGNPDLKPQRNFSWEIGARQDLFGGGLGLGATYFNNHFDDAIVTVYDSAFNSTTVNNQDIDAQGVETFVEVTPFEALYVRFDYTFTHTDVLDSEPSQALRRPKHQFNVTAAYDVTDYLQLTGNLLTVGGRQDIGYYGGYINPKPYTVLNLAANVRILENLEAYVQGNNVTDTAYEPADGFAGPGAQAIFGVRARF